jgi:hypothetical protein
MTKLTTAYWAFVPYRLPPDVPPDWELTRRLSEADHALSELAGLGRIMPNPHLLIGPFVRRPACMTKIALLHPKVQFHPPELHLSTNLTVKV